jgi:hypothetical protein
MPGRSVRLLLSNLMLCVMQISFWCQKLCFRYYYAFRVEMQIPTLQQVPGDSLNSKCSSNPWVDSDQENHHPWSYKETLER